MPDETVETGYSVGLKKQSIEDLKQHALEAGFNIGEEETQEHIFYMKLEK